MGRLLNSNETGDDSKKPSKEEIIDKWEKLGFLKGLKGHIKEDLSQLYCCKASRLLSGDTKN
jgi:hypothetical protein